METYLKHPEYLLYLLIQRYNNWNEFYFTNSNDVELPHHIVSSYANNNYIAVLLVKAVWIYTKCPHGIKLYKFKL